MEVRNSYSNMFSVGSFREKCIDYMSMKEWQFQGPKKASSENELAFACPIGEKAQICYVDGFRREDFYQILEIPETVTLVKLGEEDKKDYQVIGVVKEAFKDWF